MEDNLIKIYIDEMTDTKGWEILEKWLKEKREGYVIQLVRTSDMNNVRKLQGQINMIESILRKVESWKKNEGSLGMYLTEKEYRKMLKAKVKKLAGKNVKNKKKKQEVEKCMRN